MSKKELVYQGLENLNVVVEDRSATSPDYFRVTKLPSELNAGINTLRFKGNNEVFSEGAEVLAEILDSNGDPIYYEVGLDLESSEQVAIINIFINQDTAPGPATIFLVSTISKTITQTNLDTSRPNIRWSKTVYVDVSKPNSEEIVFESLPTVNITAGTGSYTNLSYSSSFRATTQTYSQSGNKRFKYLYRNGTALIVTASNSTQYFSSSVQVATITISSSYISNSVPALQGTISNGIFTSSLTVSGSGVVYLDTPLTYNLVNSNEVFQPSVADISDFTINYIQKSVGIANGTENTYNSVIATFYGLQPQAGTVAKIRSYYRSTGVLEYIALNETEITSVADEFGFSPNIVTASFVIPTVQRNDRIDFKFEFINPAGIVSKQVVESLNNLFIGGNTYIGGDDNLLTGSLFVAGATGTGVHISGKGAAAMVRSIGYEGFAKARAGTGQAGFVIYSGSVQPLLNASESYSGVGLELVANSSSYFKYATANGGLLDVRTNSFFLGNNPGTFISGSNGNLEISASNFSVSATGNVTASNMLLQNVAYAEFFANKQIVIDSSNSGSYFKYYFLDGNPYSVASAGRYPHCVLDLSGVGGPWASGSAAMYIRFFVNPKAPISSIITPADTGYDGQIIIETYGPAYSTGVAGAGCGTSGSEDAIVTFALNAVSQSTTLFSSWANGFGGLDGFWSTIYLQNYTVPAGSGNRWMADGYSYPDFFENTTSITPPPGLPGTDTLGKRRSLRSRITFEVDDWSSKSFSATDVEKSGFKYTNPLFQMCYADPFPFGNIPSVYSRLLQCAAGGRYAFAPGDSGWRLQSVTNYGGTVAPVYPVGIVLYSPNGTAYRIDVSNAGALSTTAV